MGISMGYFSMVSETDLICQIGISSTECLVSDGETEDFHGIFTGIVIDLDSQWDLDRFLVVGKAIK